MECPRTQEVILSSHEPIIAEHNQSFPIISHVHIQLHIAVTLPAGVEVGQCFLKKKKE